MPETVSTTAKPSTTQVDWDSVGAHRADEELPYRVGRVAHGVEPYDPLKPGRHQLGRQERVAREERRQVEQVDQRRLSLPVARAEREHHVER